MKIKDVEIIDRSDEAIKGMKKNILLALTECGLTAEGNAKLKCPVDTGNLRNSITNKVVEKDQAVYIGTNVEYAVYVEFGTGKYAEGGRQTSWTSSSGTTTRGQKAKPYLKPAIADHVQEYKKIIERRLKTDVLIL